MSTIGDLYNHLKTLCQQWFYTKSEIDNELDSLQGQIDDLEYTDIGGTFVDVTSGIQANGLAQIIQQIVNVLNTLSPPVVETKSITVTSPTSGSNYFSGGTREITAIRSGKVVEVIINFYGVNAKASSNSVDTTIGTLPSGWLPKHETGRVKTVGSTNSNLNYSQAGIKTNGDIYIRVAYATALTNVTFRANITFITA